MVASRSETKRRRRDSSPLDSNPKRTKVHAQRKFAQGVSSLSNLLNLTPVKEKPDKSRSSALSGNATNSSKGNDNTGSQTDVATSGKRALPARGAKKPSIEDMITFLCYRGTSALPQHLAHLNKAPSPEPASLSSQNASENSRSKVGDKSNRDNDKGNIKKTLKNAASSAQKAVTAAQALKRKYQEQRIKKTTVSTLSSKVKPVPLLRTTRSSAGAVASLSSKAIPKKVVKKTDANASPSRKKESSSKDDQTPKKSIRTPVGKQSNTSKTSTPSSLASGSRGGLRSGGLQSESVSRSTTRNLESNTPLKKKKKQSAHVGRDSKKLATSLSDFSSEDDQPLVKKHKPLVQVQKLIKKSIANIGRKMKLEPRRSKRGLPVSPLSPTSSPIKRLSGSISHPQSSPINRVSGSKEEQKASKKGSAASKELNGILPRSNSLDNQKKDGPIALKSTSTKMKKGYVIELVTDNVEDSDTTVETRSRRGSRDIRDIADDKAGGSSETKTAGSDSKRKDSAKSIDQLKKTVGSNSSKPLNPKLSTVLKSQVDALSAVLKSPPDLRIPASIKRPLTAVGITNPMAIAAAAAVVCKPSVKTDEKGKSKELSKEKKEDLMGKEPPAGQLSPKPSKSLKDEEKVMTGQSKSRLETSEGKIPEIKKDVKVERAKVISPRKKTGDSSEEDSKPILCSTSKDTKKTRQKVDSDSTKETIIEEDLKISRPLRKNVSKVLSDEDEVDISSIRGAKITAVVKKNSDDESKVSSRARRSTNRSVRKHQISDEEGSNEAQPDGEEGSSVRAIQSRKKVSSTENESEVDSNLKSSNRIRNTRKLRAQSSDDENRPGKTNKPGKKKSFDEYSSENDDSENDFSDEANFTASKPSTRSAAKTKETGRTPPSRLTRSGKKSPVPENYFGRKKKPKSETNVSSSEDDSDSEQPPRIPKTRSKTVRSISNNKEANTESSKDESDEESQPQRGRKTRKHSPTAKKRVKPARTAASSDESVTSSSDNENNPQSGNNKSRTRTKSSELDSKTSSKSKKKHASSAQTSKDVNLSDDKGRTHSVSTRRSRSPRRSSRRSVKVRTQDNKADSSATEASSSESSPSQNRRVLRQRRGFFSFAEVDPPSDSEEEVLAATKASLELIGQQHSTEAGPATESKTGEKAEESDISSDQQTKPRLSETLKSNKKSKDASQNKKSLSKKRVKPPSEVQPNLNEELEKTLLSINLSPQLSKSMDKSSEDQSVFDDVSTAASSVALPPASVSLGVSTEGTVPTGQTLPSNLQQHFNSQRNTLVSSLPLTSASTATPATISSQAWPSSCAVPLLSAQPSSVVPGTSFTAGPTSGLKSTSTKCTPRSTIIQKPPMGATVLPASISVASTSSSMSFTPVSSTSFLQTVSKALASSCDVSPMATSCGVSTVATLSAGPAMSSVIGLPCATVSAAAPILAASLPQMSAPASSALVSLSNPMSTSIPVSISSASVSGPLSASMALPISAPMSIPLATQLGIPLQTPVNVPLTVPMSGTMTLPLQVAPHSSGTQTAPFLLPSTLTPMLASGQAIIKKDCSTLGGMANSMGNAPSLMVGMNPLVVNSNRGAFFLSTGSTMTMASSQQQMVPGPLMPSLLSLRLPDKPAGQQTIMASSPLYVPFAFGNPGLIQTQGQIQPQMQALTGMSTISAMATNIQNTVAANIQNTVSSNIQNTVAANSQSIITTNIQNAMVSNIQNAPAPSIQNSVVASIQSAASISSAMTLTQTQGTGMGTGMKRQLVLATKNGPVSKLILSVGEDGSHVLAAASPNSISTSEAQTLMSVMQPIKPPGPAMSIAGSQSLPTPLKTSLSTVAPKLAPAVSKGMQPSSSSGGTHIVKQQVVTLSSVPGSSSAQGSISSSLLGTPNLISVNALPIRPLPVTGVPSSTSFPTSKCVASPANSSSASSQMLPTSSLISLSSSAAMSVTKSVTASSTTPNNAGVHCPSRGVVSAPSTALSDSVKITPLSAVASARTLTSTANSPVKPELIPISSSRPAVPPGVISTSSMPMSLLQERPLAPSNSPASISSELMLSKANVLSSLELTSSKPLVLRQSISGTQSGSQRTSSLVKVAAPTSPAKSVSKPVDLKPFVPASINLGISTAPTSRIPSAPAALAALKSPSGTPSSARAVAKTGSSRKPYSTAASYAAGKTSDSAASIEVKPVSTSVYSSPSQEPSIVDSNPPPAGVRLTSSPGTPKLTVTPKVNSGVKPIVSSVPPPSKSPASPSMSGISELKRKSTEVELAPTHRTLSMLSTAFHGNIMGKERKCDVVAKRASTLLETSSSYEKEPEQLASEKSGLDSLAEIATSLAERSAETSLSSDKRTPQHSLWTNPAKILGKETLKVPGLPITANIGVNLPTKNDLAKMKSGAVLADAVEKRTIVDLEKLAKVKSSSAGTDSEKQSVSGLLSSSKADTPRQKVQKWLDDGSKGDVEHKANCSLLNNGNSCTCDVMEEDISNLNSLAEVCVSMERINSPSKEQKIVKQGSKSAAEKKNKPDSMESSKKNPQNSSSPAKSPLPLNSHQMKVTWQNAFGVKSPSRNIKTTISSQSKRGSSAEDTKSSETTASDFSEKTKAPTNDTSDQSVQNITSQKHEQHQSKNDGSSSSGFADEAAKKSTQRRSLLGRLTDNVHQKLDTNAFSADNESSVYAFEAEKDAPVSQPFRRRSKTSSRSDEEDSTSIGSTSNPVHVSKDPVVIPVQVETDDNSSSLMISAKTSSEKNGIQTNTSPDDGSDIYYIPLGGQEGNVDDVRAVAVRLGKEGPNNRVVMSAKLVKKPPTFKHPNDDGLSNKRVKLEGAPAFLPTSMQSVEPEASTSQVHSCLDSKTSQSSGNDLRTSQDKQKHNQRDLSRSYAADSSSEDTSSLINMPTSSKSTIDSRNSMSPSSSRNRSPVSDKASPPSSQNNRKGQGRLNRQSSIDSDASEKAKSMRRGSKSKSVSSRASPSPSLPSTSSTSSGPSRPSQKSNRSYNGPVPGNVSEAPVFHPTEKEFQDPYAYIEKIRPIAEKYGLCRIVAPHSFKPDCNVEDDIRFTADNQYVHKMMDRWGPNAKEMRAIVKYIAQHNIHLKHAPLVGGMELDLPRLYTTVQNFGGLMEVMDKKRWVKVAETMRIPKSAQDRASKLDEVYCKCLLPYETLKTGERDNLFEMVEVEWEMRKERRDKRLAASAGPADQSESVSQQDDDDEEEEEEEEEDDEEDECIVKGRSMPLTTFYRTARNTTHMWFKGNSPSASEVEHEFWRHVRDRNFHICVNSGSVDCSDPPYGFPTRNSPFAKHPWNLKVLSNSNGSILRSLGSVIGVTVPTLHFGMVFTTCCWYRDPHGLPWIEYLHTGAKKIWYGIPEHGGEKFCSAMQEVAPHYVRKKALWLASDTAMVPPGLLTERKVPLCRTVQEPGQFIVVFPRAHTSSVATGYIVSESVSFATPRWLNSAMDSFKEMQKCNEPPLFSLDKLIFSIAEDPRTTLNVLNMILPSAMEILEREITYQQGLKKKGINSSERIERTKKKSTGKKAKVQKESDDMEVMECEVCSTNLYLSMVVNTEDDTGYCLVHASLYLEQDKLDPSRCKLLYTYSQNELHEFCQNLLDRIEAKSGKKGNNFSSNNSDSGSSASTSTRV